MGKNKTDTDIFTFFTAICTAMCPSQTLDKAIEAMQKSVKYGEQFKDLWVSAQAVSLSLLTLYSVWCNIFAFGLTFWTVDSLPCDESTHFATQAKMFAQNFRVEHKNNNAVNLERLSEARIAAINFCETTLLVPRSHPVSTVCIHCLLSVSFC